MARNRSRRRFLRGLGAASTVVLAGCSTDNSADPQSSERALLDRLSNRYAEPYRGDVLSFELFAPATVAGYRKTVPLLQRLDRVVPPEFDLDISAMESGIVALDGALLSLTGPTGESLGDGIPGLDAESGSVNDYTVYERDDGLLALDGNQLVLVRPDDRFRTDAREVLEQFVDVMTADDESSDASDAGTAAETFRAVDGEHILGGAVPFGSETFGEETEHVPNARSVAWGLTVEPKDNGDATIATNVAAQFPPDAERRKWFLPYVTDRVKVWTDVLSTERDGNVMTAEGTRDTRSRSGESKYLRPRGLNDPVVVDIRVDQRTLAIDYRSHDVSEASELVLPVDRRVVLGVKAIGGDYEITDYEANLSIDLRADWYRYGVFTPRTTGTHALVSPRINGEEEHPTETRYVTGETFDEWVSNR